MERDINNFDIREMIFERLKEGYGDLKEVPSKMPAMDKIGETRWYDPGETALISFQSLRMQTIWDVEIRNFYDRQQLDRSNSFIITLMPDETYPLPLFVADVDIHKEHYVHVITDLVPLSHDTDYRKKYEEPVNQLKQKYSSLPGLINEITDDIHNIFPALREFEAFTSSGRIFGNIPIEHGSQILELLSDYTNLYSSFVKDSRDCKILMKETIRNEAMERLGAFLMMMSQLDFSDDMPSMPKN
jgi:hypothetical protein